MSLINDALKRAEKSLNNNSSDQHKDRIPSFDFEPSGKNKKIFLIALLGGTLFFSALIALIMLLRSSPDPTFKIPPPNAPITPAFIPEIIVNEENTETIEQSQDPTEPGTDDTTINETVESTPSDPIEPAPSNSTESTTTEIPAVGVTKKNLNEEFIQSMVGLASRAFTGALPPNKNSEKSQPEDSKEIYSLSTAQETLDMLEEQAKNDKTVDTLENPIQDFVQNLSITGVMIADDGSQVLINNQVYSNQSIINPSLNLILTDINPHKITIKDATGTTYTKEF